MPCLVGFSARADGDHLEMILVSFKVPRFFLPNMLPSAIISTFSRSDAASVYVHMTLHICQ